MVFQTGAILVVAAAGIYGLWRSSTAEVGLAFLLYLLPAVLATVIAPIFVYRLQALRVASYTLERDGIKLNWGLRVEEIPMDTVLWVRRDSDLEDFHLPRPLLRWPGSVIGKRVIDDKTSIEYLAAESNSLVLIATPERIIAISPENYEEFLYAYQRLTELGSLSPMPARSVHPAFLLARFWADIPARVMALAGGGLSLLLLVWVSLASPSRGLVPLNFYADGTPMEYVPAVQLLLLPFLNTAFFLVNLLAGLFFYRRTDGPVAATNQALAYLLWGSGVITPILFLMAVFLILQT